jgi:hypothetical protein
MQPVCKADDNLTTCLYQLSGNLGASTSWNPKGLSRPVLGLFSFFTGPLQQWEMLAQLSITSHYVWNLRNVTVRTSNLTSNIFCYMNSLGWFIVSCAVWGHVECTHYFALEVSLPFQALRWIGEQITPYQNNAAQNVSLPNNTGNYMLCSTVLNTTISVCTRDTL